MRDDRWSKTDMGEDLTQGKMLEKGGFKKKIHISRLKKDGEV